jgi:antitoxin ParD1/3/4
MNVSLSPKLEKLINDKVKTGLYHAASEVIHEGLRLLEERDRLYQGRLKELRREVKKGLDQLDRGESIPGEQVFAELRAKARERRRKAR